jgi:4-hydroxythreonine-4-phosphate dehydrogenase
MGVKGTGKPIVGITMGDPAGIGPEIIIRALCQERIWKRCVPVVLGAPGILRKAMNGLGLALPVHMIREKCEIPGTRSVNVLQCTEENLDRVQWGRLDPRCGRAQVDFIRTGVDLALAGWIQALVTCPIHKKGLASADVSFPGHTEMLASWTETEEYAMMLVGEHLRVAPVTLHAPLKEAISALTGDHIQRVVRLTHRALKDWFAKDAPRLGVAGLNPHAGDEGLFGDEETRIILPAVAACRDAGIDVEGPFPPDSIFRQAIEGRFDAVIAMYHDQGMIPLKLLDRDNGVNLTLGLPIIRTSVDHGTAYDIAGQGIASEGSLLAAIELAAALAVK